MDENVNRIVFGCGGVAGLLTQNENLEQAFNVIRYACGKGIFKFDTAPMYGQTASEKNLGLIFKQLGDELPPYLQLGTKVHVNVAVGDFEKQIKNSLENSLKRLQVDSVYLYQLHNNLGSGSKQINKRQFKEIWTVFEKLKVEGLVKKIGITANGSYETIHSIIHSFSIDSAQVFYNLINPSAAYLLPVESDHGIRYDGMLNVCAQNKVKVYIVRALSAGVLGGANIDSNNLWRLNGVSDIKRALEIRKTLSSICPETKIMKMAALHFAFFEKTENANVILGISDIEHIRDVIHAISERDSDWKELSGKILKKFQAFAF